jgi:hypothetical protein
VAPLRLGGLRGKQSTPRYWLGGTSEVSTVGEQDCTERADKPSEEANRQWYAFRLLDKML